jgi:lysophospholipase
MENAPNHRRERPAGACFGAWHAADGWAIRRMDWPQPGRRRARGSLIFAGGRGDFIEKYLEAFAHWHDRGWNVTAFDWRGQGGSQGDGDRFDSFDVLAEDLAPLVGDWQAGAAGPRVAIGHSMGGHLLLRALVEAKPALDAAVLVAPMIAVNSAPLPGWLAPDIVETMAFCGFRDIPIWRVPPALQRAGGQRQRILTGSKERYEDELWWWEREPEWNLGAPTWGWLRAANRSAAAAFTAERLGEVRLPVLILAAGRDRLVSNAEIRRVAGQLPDARLEEFPRAAHEILREADPVRSDALARIDAFLDSRAP